MLKRFIVMAGVMAFAASAAAEQPRKKIKKRAAPHAVQTRGEFNANTAYRNDPNAVYYGGTYMGSDPDPRVRAQMLKDAPHSTGDSN